MISKSIVLACGVDHAFTLFTEQASVWWPSERRHTGDPHSEIRLVASGRFWERAASGEEVELGKVKLWEPPRRLLLDFYPGTDALHPTEVEVLFAAEGDGTRVTVHHRSTALSEALWPTRAPRFEGSWSLLLPALAAAAKQPGLLHR